MSIVQLNGSKNDAPLLPIVYKKLAALKQGERRSEVVEFFHPLGNCPARSLRDGGSAATRSRSRLIVSRKQRTDVQSSARGAQQVNGVGRAGGGTARGTAGFIRRCAPNGDDVFFDG